MMPVNNCYRQVGAAEAGASIDAPIPPGRPLLWTQFEAGGDKRGDGLRRPEIQDRNGHTTSPSAASATTEGQFGHNIGRPSDGRKTSIMGIGALRNPSNSTMSTPAMRCASASGVGSGAVSYSCSNAQRRSPTIMTSRQPASRNRHASLPGRSRSKPSCARLIAETVKPCNHAHLQLNNRRDEFRRRPFGSGLRRCIRAHT